MLLVLVFLTFLAPCTVLHGFWVGVSGVGSKALFSKTRFQAYSGIPDPYDGFVDLNRPVHPEDALTVAMANNLVNELTLNISGLSTRSADGVEAAVGKPLETIIVEQFPDLDAEPGEDEQWVSELRDIVELKRGTAIWSQRTEQEIKKELKKSLASKGVGMPTNVASVINTVYIEKLCSLSTLKKEEELAYKEFKKWVREQRQKMKKDPVPSAKIELVKKWLMRHPAAKFSAFVVKGKRATTASKLLSFTRPSVVLDEISDILDRNHSISAGGGDQPAIGAADSETIEDNEESIGGVPSGSTTNTNSATSAAAVKTGGSTPRSVLSAAPSIVQWNLTRQQLEQEVSVTTQGGNELDVIRNSLLRRLRSVRAAATGGGSGSTGSSASGRTRGAVGKGEMQQEYQAGALDNGTEGRSMEAFEEDEYFVIL